ncbi:hypothetical protein CJ179_37685 [Rhodococcus sp. ACS1]|nr:hypothetical protein CJ179_37685 [Rhodococcus sp. ACS1]
MVEPVRRDRPAEVALGVAFGVGRDICGSALQLLVNLSGMALAGWANPGFPAGRRCCHGCRFAGPRFRTTTGK